MMMHNTQWRKMLGALALFLGAAASAQATLIVRGTDSQGNQLIYDDDLDITWYDYTSQSLYWWGQRQWAQALTVDFNGILLDDWRLPRTIQPDPSCDNQLDPGGGFPLQGSGYNCIGSEMGHLYYVELGNPAGGPASMGPFVNLWGTGYWSEIEYAPNTLYAWGFSLPYGNQYRSDNSSAAFAVAVRDGDVAAVPEPGTALLLGAGIAGLLGTRRRRG